METLRQILARYPTDKDTDHSYGSVYEEVFATIRESANLVVELGILHGGSLRAWRDYFTQADIVGVDLDESRLFSEERITCIRGDVYQPAALLSCLRGMGRSDVIIDDAQHALVTNFSCLFALWELLKPGGLYVVEDAQECLGIFDLLPYCEVHDLRQVKGRSDDVLYIFRKPR